MNAIDLRNKLLDWTVANSGAERRNYLGMSSISECPLELYNRLTGQRAWNTAMHLNCYSGYLWERDIKARLQAIGLYKPGSERELKASFDSRFVGHTDGEIVDGDLLEIKSTRQEKLDRIIADRRIPESNFQQVQVYLQHGGYFKAQIVFVARDTGNLHVVEIRAISDVAQRLDNKAKRILAAFDAGTAPRCECRRCKIPSAMEPM